MGDEVVGSIAQGGGKDRHADASGLVDGIAQRVRIGCVAGRLLRAVDEHTDPGPGHSIVERRELGAIEHTPRRQLIRGLEARTGEEQGVGQEGMQVAQVVRATLGQVAVRLRDHAGRHGRELHQCRVGRLLTTEDDHRRAGRADPPEAGAEVLRTTQDARHDDVGALQGRTHVLVARAGRVGPHVLRAGGTGTEQVGVAGGQQGNTWHLVQLPWGPRPGSTDARQGGPEQVGVTFLTPPGHPGVTVAGPSRSCTGFRRRRPLGSLRQTRSERNASVCSRA